MWPLLVSPWHRYYPTLPLPRTAHTQTQTFTPAGGSLTGLAAANVLQRLGHNFTVYEKFTGPFTERGSSLGYVDIPLW